MQEGERMDDKGRNKVQVWKEGEKRETDVRKNDREENKGKKRKCN